MNLSLIIACVVIVLALIVLPLIVSYKAEKEEKDNKNEWDKIDKQIPDLEKEKLEFISTFPDELKDLYDNLKKRGLEVIAAYRNENQCGCCGVELTSSEIEQILKTKFQQCSYCDGVVI